MEDAASEIGDWEVLSAASACGASTDDDEAPVVSGGGGDVRPDYFALGPAAAADPDAESPGAGPWSEPEDDFGGGGKIEGLELLDGFHPVSPASFDLDAGVWSGQLPTGGGGENREGLVPESTGERGATWSADGDRPEAVDPEIEQEGNAVINRGEFCAVLQPGAGETLGSGAAAPTDALPQGQASESFHVELDGGEVDAGKETSCAGDAASSDGARGEQEEHAQGSSADAASLDGEEKDGALPLAHTPGTEGEDKQVVVWWRLPFRLLHYCAWKVKPVWSFSIAAALLGLVVLGRRMYRMKRKAGGLPQIKIAFDDKRASQSADRAASLNGALLVARRVPLLRTSSGAVLPWSVVQER